MALFPVEKIPFSLCKFDIINLKNTFPLEEKGSVGGAAQ